MDNILFFLTPKAMCVHLNTEDTLRQAIGRMEKARYAALPILNRKGEYCGTLTEGDVLWALKNKCNLDLQQAKHLKIMDHTCKVGVLQIDCNTKLFKEMVGFQLERYIPYINLAGGWTMSDTTRDDRMAEQIQIYKKQSKWETIAGIAMILAYLVMGLAFGMFEDAFIFCIFGIFCMVSAAYRMIRLRGELTAIQEAREELEKEEQDMKAYLEDKTPTFHKTEE